MNDDDFQVRLEAVLARHTGKPAKVHNLQRLTGGANRTTMSFDVGGDAGGADRGEPRRQCILQLGTQTFDSVDGIVPQITPAEQARVMIAAARVGVPAPRVIAILEPADGLGDGYITERVDGETLGARIVRDERFAARAARDGAAMRRDSGRDSSDRSGRGAFPDASGRGRTRRGASQHRR